ncbi:MAG: OmpH family outer membrane protein [Pseudomonadota bacterium]
MKFTSKLLATGALALGALAPIASANAQVDGRLATSSVSRALLDTNAMQAALTTIPTTYSAQLQSLEASQTQLNDLLRPFDANGDGRIDDNEVGALDAAPNLANIRALQTEIAGIEEQLTAAQVYAVEQLLVQYNVALEQVATQQQIVVVLDPTSLQYVADGGDITSQVTTTLDTLVPQVGIVPPQGWRPQPQSLQVFQEVQRRLLLRQAIARQAAQQEQQAEQPAQQAPSGR